MKGGEIKGWEYLKSVGSSLLCTIKLTRKKIGFEKVIEMMDDMAAVLRREWEDDDHKKECCTMQFDLGDDKKKQ